MLNANTAIKKRSHAEPTVPQKQEIIDETALFYKLLPSATLSDSKVTGIKIDKKRLSIAFLVNATGTELINPIVIGHNKKPRSFGNWNPNSIVDYYFNSNAWMTMDIFSDWLLKLNNKMKIFNRHILLLIDNAGGHNITEETKKKLTHVNLEYFDPNVTSHIQPLDMGIIRSFKDKPE